VLAGTAANNEDAFNVSSHVPHPTLNLPKDHVMVSLGHFGGVQADGQLPGLRARLQAGSRARLGAWARQLVGNGGLDAVAVGLVALVVYALHGYQGTLDRDLGVFMYGGEHVAHGVPPYVGIFNSVGPLADAIPGLAIWLGHFVGVAPLLSARVFFTLISAASCAMLAVLARDAFGSRTAGFLAAAIFLTFEDFLRLASDGPREKTAMVLFLLIALIAMGRRRWLLAGVFTAMATLTWQPVLLVAVTVLAVFVIASPGRRLGTVLRFVLGGMLPLLATVVYFASQHALHTAFQGFVLVNVLYTVQTSVFTAESGFWTLMWDDYHGSMLVAAVGLLAIFDIGRRTLPRVVRRRGRPVADHRTALVAALGAGAAVGSLWTLGAINGPPDLFELLPFAALGAAGLVLSTTAQLTPTRLRALVVGIVVLATLSAGAESVFGRTDRLAVQRADVHAVLRSAPAGATVVSIDSPEVLSLAGLTNPTPFQIFDPGMQGWIDHRFPGGERGYAHYINALHPTLIVVGTAFDGSWPDRLLAHHYWRVGRGPTWVWYVRRDVGPIEMTRLLQVNRRVMLRAGAVVGTINPAGRALRRLAGAQPGHHGHHGRRSSPAQVAGSRGID
jgi:hypothetical protein